MKGRHRKIPWLSNIITLLRLWAKKPWQNICGFPLPTGIPSRVPEWIRLARPLSGGLGIWVKHRWNRPRIRCRLLLNLYRSWVSLFTVFMTAIWPPRERPFQNHAKIWRPWLRRQKSCRRRQEPNCYGEPPIFLAIRAMRMVLPPILMLMCLLMQRHR